MPGERGKRRTATLDNRVNLFPPAHQFTMTPCFESPCDLFVLPKAFARRSTRRCFPHSLNAEFVLLICRCSGRTEYKVRQVEIKRWSESFRIVAYDSRRRIFEQTASWSEDHEDCQIIRHCWTLTRVSEMTYIPDSSWYAASCAQAVLL